MTSPLQLTRADARRVAVRAQWLTARRPEDVEDVVRGVGVVQVDPVSAVAPSADVVMWSRLGATYDVRDLEDAVNEQRVVELRGVLRTAEDVGLFRAEMAVWPGVGDDVPAWRRQSAEWVEANNGCRLDVLDRLRSDGPLPLKELPDTCVVPWRSSGWNNNKNVPMLLDLLVARGEVAVAGRRGREKLWDLAERVYPDPPDLSLEESRRALERRRLEVAGIARSKGPSMPGEVLDVGDAGVPAVVEDVRGEWRVDPVLLDQPFEGRTALLSPLDRLIHERKRMGEVFGFEYVLEMYKPVEKRRWGFYALPVLHGDRLVGKVDATADRKRGVLRLDAVHEDDVWTDETREAVDAEIADLAAWLGLVLERA